MKLIDTSLNPQIAIVGCLHGDEAIGKRVFEHYQQAGTPGLRLILANTKALNKNQRFIDEDLNRCFPGDPNGSHEQKVAAKLLPHLSDIDYVIDLHSTTSSLRMTPIVLHLSSKIRTVVNLCESYEIVLMGQRRATKSLIGSVKNGVSLEFGEQYATTAAALGDITTIIDGLLKNRARPPQPRRLFKMLKTIPLDAKVPANSKNFQYLPALDIYPFLLHEKSYTTHQGFAAKRYSELLI